MLHSQSQASREEPTWSILNAERTENDSTSRIPHSHAFRGISCYFKVRWLTKFPCYSPYRMGESVCPLLYSEIFIVKIFGHTSEVLSLNPDEIKRLLRVSSVTPHLFTLIFILTASLTSFISLSPPRIFHPSENYKMTSPRKYRL